MPLRTSFIWTTDWQGVVEILQEFWVSLSEISWQITDFGAWLPHIGNYLAQTYPNISHIHCIDPTYRRSGEVLKMTQEHLLEVLQRQTSEMSHPLDGIRSAIAQNSIALLALRWLSDKIDYNVSSSVLPSESQDIVLWTYLLSNVDFFQPLLAEFIRLLKDNGCLLLIDHKLPASDVSAWTFFRKILEGKGLIGRKVDRQIKDTYSNSAILLGKENLVWLQEAIIETVWYNWVKKITIRHKYFFDDAEDDYEFVIIPYERIEKWFLTCEEGQILGSIGFNLEGFMNNKREWDNYWTSTDSDDSPAIKFNSAYIVLEKNWEKWEKCKFDEEIFEKMAYQVNNPS